ncbi:MAG: hypothetical protein IT385_02840 [Deltaproteobacteria bacterium]|nr:hypothetical protein [Deltaproteobacteria bacterium]
MSDTRIERFQAMKARFPQSEMPRWSLASALAEAGQVEPAIAELKELVALKPDYCVAWLELGRLSAGRGDVATARPALEEAIRLALAQGHSAPRIDAEALLEDLD